MAFDFDLDEELRLEQELFQQESDSFNDDIEADTREDELIINRTTIAGDTIISDESGQVEISNGNDFKTIAGERTEESLLMYKSNSYSNICHAVNKRRVKKAPDVVVPWVSTSAVKYGENIPLSKSKTPLDMAITMKEDREALIGFLFFHHNSASFIM